MNNFDLEYSISEFKKEIHEIFDTQGKCYKGMMISHYLAEQMFEIIKNCEIELNKYDKPDTYFIKGFFLPVTIIPINNTDKKCSICRGYGKECENNGAWVYCIIFNHFKVQTCGLDISGESNVGCNNFIYKNPEKDCHLCTDCKFEFATCESSPKFGTGLGNDNIYECDNYFPK